MKPVTVAALNTLFQDLGERCSQPGALYLLGGSALCLLGSPRQTLDFDYTAEVASEAQQEFQEALTDLAVELHLDLEEVPIGEFVPLPARPMNGGSLLGNLGQLPSTFLIRIPLP